MASRLTAEERAEIDNALKAAEELAFRGHTNRRCPRDGSEFEVIDHSGKGYEVICKLEGRIIERVRA